MKAASNNPDMLSGYSSPQLEELTLRWLAETEKRAKAKEVASEEKRAEQDNDDDILQTLEEDAARAHYEAKGKVKPDEFHHGMDTAAKYLKRRGITFNQQSHAFKELGNLFSKATHAMAQHHIQQWKGLPYAPVDFKSVLDKIADELPTGTLKRIPILSADKWVLVSGLYKSIRRGDARLAASFAVSLACADRRMLWRKLLVIIFEDVGPANPDLICEAVAVCKSPASRREIGDTEVAVYLAQKMARSPKSRFITEALSYTVHAKALAKASKCAEKAGDRKLGKIILDRDKPLPERFLALWALAGTKTYPAQSFSRVGDKP